MTRLNQVVAIEKGCKSDVQASLTSAYHDIQHEGKFNGITRRYEPKAEDGEHLPDESTLVQVTAERTLADVSSQLERLWNVVATKDAANCVAKADIVVDGTTIVSNVPVTTLLWLEKQLTDVRTFLSKMPVLDPGKVWEYDEAAANYRSNSVKTLRTKKVMRNHVKSEATKEHPAQVDVYTEDETAGTWTVTYLSGAFPQARKNLLLERVAKLQAAVKSAREEGNTIQVTDVDIASPILEFLTA